MGQGHEGSTRCTPRGLEAEEGDVMVEYKSGVRGKEFARLFKKEELFLCFVYQIQRGLWRPVRYLTIDVRGLIFMKE